MSLEDLRFLEEKCTTCGTPMIYVPHDQIDFDQMPNGISSESIQCGVHCDKCKTMILIPAGGHSFANH